MRFRRQDPKPTKRGAYWVMRYRETVVGEDGSPRPMPRVLRLGLVSELTRKRAGELVEEEIAKVNQRCRATLGGGPKRTATLGYFVERVYFPLQRQRLRPRTLSGYRDMWEDHFRSRIASTLVCEVETHHVTTWLNAIAAEDRTPDGKPLSRETLKHLKSWLSGLFRTAKAQGYYETKQNPVRDTFTPVTTNKGGETYAYSLDTVKAMLAAVHDSEANTIVATAALTGLRRSEIGAMRWEHWTPGQYDVSGSIYRGKLLDPKTVASGAAIPVIPYLAKIWALHRERMGSPKKGWMFPSEKETTPVSLDNVAARKIKPVLNCCAVCGKSKDECKEEKAQKVEGRAEHDYCRDPKLPAWRGWHAFRRGLATNLHDLGVDDKTIQAILRHSDVRVTQDSYIKTLPEQTVNAMDRIESSLTGTVTGTQRSATHVN